MAAPSGIAAQLGYTIETTYGQYIAPATFQPFISENLSTQRARIESDGIYAGYSVLETSQWAPGMVTVGGDTQMELFDANFGKLMKLAVGFASTSGSGTYTHTFSPQTTVSSATLQVGRPDNTGTVQPYTYTGCKVASWEIAAKAGENVTAGFTWVGQSSFAGSRTVSDGVTTNGSATVTSATASWTTADQGKVITSGTSAIPANATILTVNSSTSITLSANCTATTSSNTLTIGAPLATASYSTQKPFSFKNASITVGGTTFYPKDISIKGDNGLAVDRTYVGSQYIREPLPAGYRNFTVDITDEHDGIAIRDAVVNATEASFSAVFTSGSKTATFSGNVRYDGADTNVQGRGILERKVPLKFVRTAAGADSTAFQCVLVNTDSSI